MELEMTTRDFLVSSLSPYSFFHTAYPFNYGSALYEGNVTISNRQVDSKNRVFIEGIEVGKKGFADPPVKLPVRLAVSILKDVNGDIELEVPVSGNLDDPKFNYWPAVLKVLENTLEKLVTAPFRLFANMFSVDEDHLQRIPWYYGQDRLEKEQTKRAKSVGKVLTAKPELAVTFTPINNIEREKDYVAIFASKTDYYLSRILKKTSVELTADDTIAIASIAHQGQ